MSCDDGFSSFSYKMSKGHSFKQRYTWGQLLSVWLLWIYRQLWKTSLVFNHMHSNQYILYGEHLSDSELGQGTK